MSDPTPFEITCTDGSVIKVEQQDLLQAFEGYAEELQCRIDENAFYIEPEVFSIEFKKQTLARHKRIKNALDILRNSMVQQIRPVNQEENKGVT